MRIFEGPRAVEDDIELVDENQTIEGDGTELDGGNFPHLKKVWGCLRRDQPKERPRDLPKEDMREQSKEKWYECQGRYDDKEYNDELYQEKHGFHNESTIFNPKLDISNFEGMMQPIDFINWLNTVEMVFEYYDPS